MEGRPVRPEHRQPGCGWLDGISEENTMKPLKGFNERNGIIRFVPEELWTEVRDIVKEAVIKTIHP